MNLSSRCSSFSPAKESMSNFRTSSPYTYNIDLKKYKFLTAFLKCMLSEGANAAKESFERVCAS